MLETVFLAAVAQPARWRTGALQSLFRGSRRVIAAANGLARAGLLRLRRALEAIVTCEILTAMAGHSVQLLEIFNSLAAGARSTPHKQRYDTARSYEQ